MMIRWNISYAHTTIALPMALLAIDTHGSLMATLRFVRPSAGVVVVTSMRCGPSEWLL